nr:probable C-mannosyltransferase DPY19L3 [Procambarus clarkii]
MKMKQRSFHRTQDKGAIKHHVRMDATHENINGENSEVDDVGTEDTLHKDEDLETINGYDEDEPSKQEDEVFKSKVFVEAANDDLESSFSTEEEYNEEIDEELTAMYCLLWKIINYSLGVMAVLVLLTQYPQYLNILHENQLWFSNIKEIEREISFRTEQGLYYSYFKQIIDAPSWIEGCNELMTDNRTEHGRTINIIHRFNVLPEMILGAAFRWLSSQEAPSVFYVSCVFGLHGMFIVTLYITAWYLSDSILAGMIAVILFIIHRIDTTRVNYTVPLRESFAIPLLFLQIFLMCTFIRSGRWQSVKLALILVVSVAFLQSWQFGPFVALCQLFCFLCLGRSLFLSEAKVMKLVAVVGVSLVVSCGIQASPPLVISSPALSMVVPALILSATPAPDASLATAVRTIITAAELSLLLLATVLINGTIKIYLSIDADSHVYQLLFAKLQIGDERDFDSRLYMCNEAFDYIDKETLERLSDSGLLPVYSICVLVLLISCARSFLLKIPERNLKNDSVDSSICNEHFHELSSLNKEKSHCSLHLMRSDQECETCSHVYKMEKSIGIVHSRKFKKDSSSEKVPKKERCLNSVCASYKSSQDQSIIQGRPELVFFLGLSVMWSILAALIIRLKVIWMPTVCVLTGVFVADTRVYSSFIMMGGKLSSYSPKWFPGLCKTLICFSYIAFIGQRFWGKMSSELWPEEMYEFWDPDTVELMEWIQSYTPPEAVFAGSMQLLAGVKLCTGRHITNHPHYEDSWLRHRTHQIYQIYGREAPDVVYNALKTAGATHIILEDSICFVPPDDKHPLCRLTDIVDLHNRHIPESGGHAMSGLHKPLHGRFCDMIRHKLTAYNRFFSLVMSNKTFRVYRVATT